MHTNLNFTAAWRRPFLTGLVVSIFASLSLVAISATTLADDWAQFRGAGGKSAVDAKIPVKISETEGLAWKIELPGRGASSPIVVGDNVIVTCSGGSKQDQLYTVCVDAKTGKKRWEQKFWATGRCLCHKLSANAAPTPASDGKHIYAFFSSNDLACLDMDGNLVWYRGLGVDHPKAGNDVGMSSSVVVKDGIVVAQVECAQDSFAIGLDAETGSTAWELERTKKSCWASPILIAGAGQPTMVALQSVDKVTVNDLKTGKELYSLEGECSSISSSAFSNGVLYVPINGTTAIGVSGTDFETLWTGSKIKPSSMSTVVHSDKLFTLNSAGVLNSFNLADGSDAQQARVGGRYWATPTVAGNNMYFFDQTGKASVVDLGKMEVIHKHTFEGEVFLGSPAISGNAMFVRSDKFLYRFSE